MSLLQRRSARITLTALAVMGLGVSVPLLASADPSPTAACLDAGNVWVHGEIDDAGSGGCATEFGTGVEALASAGFEVGLDSSGFLNTIDGAPAVRGPEDWWAYAHSDEDLSAWEFYQVGATQSEPVAGSIDAWRLMHTYSQEVSTFPLVTPADLLADVETPSSPSASPSPSTQPSATASPSAMPSASASASATPTPSTSPAPGLPHTGN